MAPSAGLEALRPADGVPQKKIVPLLRRTLLISATVARSVSRLLITAPQLWHAPALLITAPRLTQLWGAIPLLINSSSQLLN